MSKKRYTFIDLFAGCGGLSEGFYREGFKALAHVEIDHWACETLRTRMKYYGYKDYEKEVIEHDITSKDILKRIDNAVNGRSVDIIIGGPPCQAYSTAGRVRDGKRMATDPRNYLFESYVKILNHYKPIFFVFENFRLSFFFLSFPGSSSSVLSSSSFKVPFAFFGQKNQMKRPPFNIWS